MHRLLLHKILIVAGLGCAMLFPACTAKATYSWSADAQAVVEGVKKENAECVRLSVHCQPSNAKASINCASTAPEKVGKPSDAEDLKAMQTGEAVVLEEKDSLDVTVPILAKDGKHTAACGVTLKSSGATRDQLVEKAKAIAAKVEAGLRGTGGGSCCDSGGGSCCDSGGGACCSDKDKK
jgi:intracellular sulfur oxidation DsrE/DsrF family protein